MVIEQTQALAKTYGVSLVELVSPKQSGSSQVDWANEWKKLYPILGTYQAEVDTTKYADQLRQLLGELQKEYGYNKLDALLVLKDILANTWEK